MRVVQHATTKSTPIDLFYGRRVETSAQTLADFDSSMDDDGSDSKANTEPESEPESDPHMQLHPDDDTDAEGDEMSDTKSKSSAGPDLVSTSLLNDLDRAEASRAMAAYLALDATTRRQAYNAHRLSVDPSEFIGRVD